LLAGVVELATKGVQTDTGSDPPSLKGGGGRERATKELLVLREGWGSGRNKTGFRTVTAQPLLFSLSPKGKEAEKVIFFP